MSDYKKILADFDKSFGKGKLVKLGDAPRETYPTISSGSIYVNNALAGGYQQGRVIEVFGPEGCGKTTLSLHAIAEAQEKNKKAGFIDMEHAFNADYAETLGVNISELFFSQPDYGEEALNILIEMVKSKMFDLIVIDSVASLVPKSELDGEVGEAKMGVMARMMGQGLRKVVALAEKNNCILYFLNQTREKIGIMFGDSTTTPGGNALKFACSQRLHITQSSKLKNGEDIYGHIVKVHVIKNKIGRPFIKTQFNLIYGKGIDKLAEIIDLACETEVMKKAGAGWYSYGETKLCQGNDKLVKLFEDNPELLEEIKTKTLAKL